MGLYDKDTGKLDVPDGMAVRLTNVGTKWDPDDLLGDLVPERKTHVFALDPRKWVGTFWSLTNKDPHKIVNYRPELVKIKPGTMVADMALANVYHRTKDPKAAADYMASMVPLDSANLDDYKYPELLIPR